MGAPVRWWVAGRRLEPWGRASVRLPTTPIFAHGWRIPVYHWYRRLADMRRTLPVVALGDFTMLLPEDEQVYAFTRCHEDTELLVVANFSDAGADPAFADAESWCHERLLLANCGGVPDEATLRLRPWELRAYMRRRPTG